MEHKVLKTDILFDNDYYKYITLCNLMNVDNYFLERQPNYKTRENILYDFYLEFKNLSKEELKIEFDNFIKYLYIKYKF